MGGGLSPSCAGFDSTAVSKSAVNNEGSLKMFSVWYHGGGVGALSPPGTFLRIIPPRWSSPDYRIKTGRFTNAFQR